MERLHPMMKYGNLIEVYNNAIAMGGDQGMPRVMRFHVTVSILNSAGYYFCIILSYI